MKWIAVGVAMLVAGCSGVGSGLGDPNARAWKPGANHADYTVARDSAPGTWLLRGSWDFAIGPDSVISGTWRSHWLVADTLAQIGPQVGSGVLSGRLQSDGTLSIDLNPDLVDNNVWVQVGSRESGAEATWTWSTIAGPWAAGPFRLDPPVF